MKKICFFVTALLILGSTVSSYADWLPSSGAGYHIKSVTYNLTNPTGTGTGRIQIVFKEPAATYFYNFYAMDYLAVVKANAIYSGLLAAQATGNEIYLLIGDNQSFSTFQIGTDL